MMERTLKSEIGPNTCCGAGQEEQFPQVLHGPLIPQQPYPQRLIPTATNGGHAGHCGEHFVVFNLGYEV